MSIQWIHYPKSVEPPQLAREVAGAFEAVESDIDSQTQKLSSNEVLSRVESGLVKMGFEVEIGKQKAEKVFAPVLFGLNGQIEKSFEADALHRRGGFVLEVEAGRAVANNQFLKDLFQACMMHDVDQLGIAVRNIYTAGNSSSHDFDRVVAFFDTLYASSRLTLPLKGVTIIGY